MMDNSCYPFLSSHHKHLLPIISVSSTNCPSHHGQPHYPKNESTKLLDFVQSKLMVPLDRDDAQKLVSARITGTTFLEGARYLLRSLTVGACVDLSTLAKTIVQAEGKFYLINTTQTASR